MSDYSEDSPGVSGLAHLESRIRNALTLPRKGYQSTFTNAINALNELLAYVAVADLKANKFYAHERDDLVRHIAERDETIRALRLRIEQAEFAVEAAERERDTIKGDYDEAAHFARYFVRDDPDITPRGAIIRLADKCTSLLCRLQAAGRERDELRAQLDEYERAPTVATVGHHYADTYRIFGTPPPVGTELIARPTRKGAA